MGEVIIKRVKADRQDRLRDYRIFIDGVKVSSIANGAQVSISVADGEHDVRLGIDWCRSNVVRINVSPARATVLECGPNAQPWEALLYVTFLSHAYLWLHEHGVGEN